MRWRGAPLVGAALARVKLGIHELERGALHDIRDEVTMGGGNGILWKEIHRRADFGGFLAHGGIIIPRKLALPKQQPGPLFHHAALQHVGIETPQNLLAEARSAISANS